MVRVTDSRRNSSLNKHSTESQRQDVFCDPSPSFMSFVAPHTFSLITMTTESPVVPVSRSSLRHVTNKPEKLADVPPAVCFPVAFG